MRPTKCRNALNPDTLSELKSAFLEAKENDAVLMPFLIEGVGGVAEFNQADLIHPNVEGQKRVAENVWMVLQKVVQARGTGRK